MWGVLQGPANLGMELILIFSTEQKAVLLLGAAF